MVQGAPSAQALDPCWGEGLIIHFSHHLIGYKESYYRKRQLPYMLDQEPRLLNVSFCWKRRLQFKRGHVLFKSGVY